jgi:predicted DNA-binding protein
MKTGRPKKEGSIYNEGGRAMLGVSKETREKINRLAKEERKHVSDYLKEMADEQLKQNELMELKMEALKASYTSAELLITHIYHTLGGRKPINTGIRRTIRAMIAQAGLGIETK